MDLLPPELHAYICEVACFSDGGWTGRSLSLVSHYYRAVAAPFLYQSLAIFFTERNVGVLVERLKGAETGRCRPVKHLFVCHESPTPSTQDLTDFLSLAAPTLETLSLVFTYPAQGTSVLARLFRTSFPRLRELSVSGFYPFPALSAPFLPSLTHLHLHGNRNPHGLFSCDALSDAFCPSLTHLRISGLSMAVSFAKELHAALLPNESADLGSAPRLPSRVRRVIVEEDRAKSRPPNAGGGNLNECRTAAKDLLMIAKLQLIQTELGADSRVRYSLLPQPKSDGAAITEQFRQCWEERIGGGKGCWS